MLIPISPKMHVRIVAVIFTSIFVSTVLVVLNAIRADDLTIVPFLFAGYLAIELLALLVRSSKRDKAK